MYIIPIHENTIVNTTTTTITISISISRHDVIPIVMGARVEDYVKAAPEKSFIHVDQFKEKIIIINSIFFVDILDLFGFLLIFTVAFRC